MHSENKVFKIFVDFDGTITKKDVGEAMFLEFGDPVKAKEIIDRWIKAEISSVQSWQGLCETVKDFNPKKFMQFLDTIEMDDYFKEFTKYCSNNNYEIRILSDGLDYYINEILKREKLDHIKAFTNVLNFTNDGNLVPHFPHTDEECKKCANCKRNHILENSSDSDYTVYIGDGYSDACPVQYCDFIFAKDSLLRYCEINRISYFPFNNFSDVMKRLDELRSKKRLKKRHQAELKRREVYLLG